MGGFRAHMYLIAAMVMANVSELIGLGNEPNNSYAFHSHAVGCV